MLAGRHNHHHGRPDQRRTLPHAGRRRAACRDACGSVPKGLWPCLRCGEWRGDCFDTVLRELVVRVHCACENDNCRAACGELLYSRKLNANFFDPADGSM